MVFLFIDMIITIAIISKSYVDFVKFRQRKCEFLGLSTKL